MARNRWTWLAFFAVALVGLLLLLYETSGSQERSDRARSVAGAGGRGRSGLAAGEEAGGGGRRASASRLREMIARYGGFVAKGRVLLHRPEGPGAGVAVRLATSLDGLEVAAAGRTDDSGRFTLQTLPRAGSYRLSLSGELVAPYDRSSIDPPDGPELDFGDLSLKRIYLLHGRVLGEGRAGVFKAEVAIIRPAGGARFSFYRAAKEAGKDDPVLARTESGPDGSFSIRMREPGIFSVRARAAGWAVHYRPDVVLGGTRPVTVTLALTRGYPVVGYVLDASGRPVSDASVALFAMGRPSFTLPKQLARTDGTGRFELRVEPTAAEYVASVVPGEGLNLTHRFKVPLEQDLILRVPGGGALTGRVIDTTTQQPVPGAEVLIALGRSRGGGMGLPEYSKALKTDAYGAFRIEGVGEGYLQSLSVRADGFADLRAGMMFATDPGLWREISSIPIAGDAETKLPPLRLRRGRTLRGVVRDAATHRPLQGASVQLWDFIMGNRATTTEADGSYAFSGVGDRVAMIVEMAGFASLRDPPFPGFALKSGETASVRNIDLAPGGTVKGSVRNPAGEPVAGALVRLQPAQTGWRAWMAAMNLRALWTYTGPRGDFALEGVPPMKLHAEAELEGYDRSRSKDRAVRAGETLSGLDIVFNPAARISGRVLGRDGRPVAAARLTIARDPGGNASAGAQWRALAGGTRAFSDDRGRFEVTGVPVGDVIVRVEADGFATTTQHHKGISPGQRVTALKVVLTPAFEITGRVLGPDAKPVPFCWVRAQQTASPDGEPVRQLLGARVDRDGRFVLRNLPAGNYRLEVRVNNNLPGRPRLQSLTLENVTAGATDLQLTLQPAG